MFSGMGRLALRCGLRCGLRFVLVGLVGLAGCEWTPVVPVDTGDTTATGDTSAPAFSDATCVCRDYFGTDVWWGTVTADVDHEVLAADQCEADMGAECFDCWCEFL